MLMNKLAHMNKVYFAPWVGSQYSDGINGRRIMVLGHVHVCDGCNNCGVEKCDAFSTQKVVEDYIVWRKNGTIPSPGYEEWLQTYLNFVKAFFGLKPEPEVEENDFWNRIVFYNYLQIAVPTPTTKAPHEAYIRAQEPFINIINHYEPDVIFVWGKPTYNNTPAYKGTELEPLKFGNIVAERYEYTLESSKKCVMIKFHHPSFTFSHSQWHEIIKQAHC